jgi:hypothetical protein
VLKEDVGFESMIPRERGDEDQEDALRAIEADWKYRRWARVDAMCNLIFAEWAEFDRLPFKDAFRTMRDKHIGHLEVRISNGGYRVLDLNSLGIKRGDLGEAITRMESLVTKLTSVFRDADFQMDRAVQMFDTHGRKFWSVLRT